MAEYKASRGHICGQSPCAHCKFTARNVSFSISHVRRRVWLTFFPMKLNQKSRFTVVKTLRLILFCFVPFRLVSSRLVYMQVHMYIVGLGVYFITDNVLALKQHD